MINAAVSAIAGDISKQSRILSKQVVDTTINDIMQGYFGDTIGLGPLFLEATEDYYSYKICNKPGCPSSKFTIVTGSGSKTTAMVHDPCCAGHKLHGGKGVDENGVFCYKSYLNIQTYLLCLSGMVASCHSQSMWCSTYNGKIFLNP